MVQIILTTIIKIILDGVVAAESHDGDGVVHGRSG